MRITLPHLARVSADYQAAYPDPLILAAGDSVRVIKRDPEFPGWLWCTDQRGKSAWVPESYLDLRGNSGVLRQNYSSAELTVCAGEQLTLLKFECGWFWACRASGQPGWVPEKVIAL